MGKREQQRLERERGELQAAVELVAKHLNGVLKHGAECSGLIPGIADHYGLHELDVEVTIRARERVTGVQVEAWRQGALDELLEPTYRLPECATTVRDRSTWVRSSRTKGCSKPIVVAVVTEQPLWDRATGRYKTDERGHLVRGPTYTFRCHVHRDDHGRDREHVKAVIELRPHELERVRRERAERQRLREAFERMTEAERIAHDARIVGHPAAAALGLEAAVARELDAQMCSACKAVPCACCSGTPECDCGCNCVGHECDCRRCVERRRDSQ